ncbi:MAG: hypothetical protein HC846_07910 [Blastocatellia bacterium]|nr:hypothetical protein [Blastocatellia bacterium]
MFNFADAVFFGLTFLLREFRSFYKYLIKDTYERLESDFSDARTIWNNLETEWDEQKTRLYLIMI